MPSGAATARAFAIKAAVSQPVPQRLEFVAQKTMYGGKRIAAGDTLFVFASENEGGTGLVARGRVFSAEPVPRRPDLDRQTPRVSIVVTDLVAAVRPLGRRELKPFSDWGDDRPETELNFKFYRQATNKIVGITDATAAFLARYF